jgi:ubiquinone/menaquinone biosynthesis C-methylase UbiE
VTARAEVVTGVPGLSALLTSIVDELPVGAPVLTIGRPGGRSPHLLPGAVRLELDADDRTVPFPDEAFGCVISLDIVDAGGTGALAAEHVRVCRAGGVVVIAGHRPDILHRLDLPDLRERRLWPEDDRDHTRRWLPHRPPAGHNALVAVVARKRAADVVADARLRYRRAAAGYPQRYESTAGMYFRELEERYVLALLGDVTGLAVLDIGTGTGRFAATLASRAGFTMGIDVSPEMLAQARVKTAGHARLALMDGTRTGLRDGAFDAILCIGGLEAVGELGPAFREVARLLKPGGRFVFTSFNARRLRPFGSYRLGPDTRAHGLATLASALDRARLRLVRYRGTFFISPGFVWRYHGALRWTALRRPYVRSVVAVNRLLDAVPRGRRRCGQFVVLAEKA